ncbi:Methyltransferase domain-containing protein [Aquimarina amphilecti]|uniref:Methyltransferase domain-containing protein n=1 Tax=Aquimarina amphilecti TaxID=1038014 RepID=A0A1H7PVL6_AQUAM|nr:class I SAM-dependent methyltransferase [Aquimarina amphilecti]SEL39117.1 Methyltransferase domain-containing protein [Aquimarina amphilecti]
MNCALCGSKTVKFSVTKKRAYHRCTNCDGIGMHPSYFLSNTDEKDRYETHNNDVTDLGYQNFVSPIVNTIIENYGEEHKGLDFGSGSGPVITSMLRNTGYIISTYDPFFDPNSKALQQTYDYIACCEVMEHFYHPNHEFKLLHSLLREKGNLYCKTYLYDDSIDFNSWWYKNDPTHVFFYTKKTLNWIKNKYHFSELLISNKLISFKK